MEQVIQGVIFDKDIIDRLNFFIREKYDITHYIAKDREPNKYVIDLFVYDKVYKVGYIVVDENNMIDIIVIGMDYDLDRFYYKPTDTVKGKKLISLYKGSFKYPPIETINIISDVLNREFKGYKLVVKEK